MTDLDKINMNQQRQKGRRKIRIWCEKKHLHLLLLQSESITQQR